VRLDGVGSPVRTRGVGAQAGNNQDSNVGTNLLFGVPRDDCSRRV